MATDAFSAEARAKLYYFVGKQFPKARLTKVGIAKRYVGGEKQSLLEQSLREKLGRIDFDGVNVDDKLKNFVLTATGAQLLGLLELMPKIESETHRDPARGAALSKRIDGFLAELGNDSRFDAQGQLLKPTTNFIGQLLSDPFGNKIGPEERVAIFYMLQEEFPQAHHHWMADGDVGGDEQRMLEDLLRKRVRRLRLANGTKIAEILKNFITDSGSVDELIVMLGLMPSVRRKSLENSAAGQGSIAKDVTKLQDRIVSLLREVGIEMAFVGDELEHIGADTSIKALADLPDRNQLRSDIVSGLKDRQPLSLIFLDLDNFKAVNDTLGHAAGDKCLENLATILSRAVAFKGRSYRYGVGDELCVLLYNSSSAEARATAERIRTAVENGNLGGGEVAVTASVGVAVSTDAGLSDPDPLMKAADAALYNSKHAGKNVVSVWPLSEDPR